ncbi:hypothetical protein GCM10020221_19050 [Streptomyces thioluteus]|uniref:Uncharacterized protein n=1 Tax=Streptomyces thioluteus TaxID=66431 RepID=A0ABP6J7B8_STRTU
MGPRLVRVMVQASYQLGELLAAETAVVEGFTVVSFIRRGIDGGGVNRLEEVRVRGTDWAAASALVRGVKCKIARA